MSSGVDQLKSLGNAGKSVEERNIPWSQQVDEASYENLASPTIEDVPGGSECNMRFQNPPFNAKENENLSANNYRNRKSITHLDPNKKCGKISYNTSKKDDLQPNAWSLHNSKHSVPDIGCSKFTRVNRQEDLGVPENVDARTTISDMNELKNIAVANSTTSAPKKTWASIASQPAKNALKTHLLASNPKKKGPGMPPPPMVPGKHDLDANAWDLPNNNIPLASIPIPSILVHTDRYSGIHVNNSEKVQSSDRESKVNEDLKEKSRANYNNSNFERQRNSSKDHSRQNWSANNSSQMPTRHPNIGGSMQVKRTDFNRKNQFNNTRSDFETSAYRDENTPRNYENPSNVTEQSSDTSHAVLEQLRDKNNYNPKDLDLEIAKLARFFVIKSYSEDDIHRSIKYEIWCSTDHGNKRLDDAYKERKKVGGNVLLFFSVNGSGHFCGVAQMITAVDYNSTSTVWSQDKWKGKFKVKWIYVKDVPNATLRHIRLETNDNKPVTNSRDTQEVPNAKGIEVLRILHSYAHATSIFDDFYHYEKKQEEEVSSKRPPAPDNVTLTQNHLHNSRSYNRQHDDWERDRDRDTRNSAKYIGTNYRERNRSSYTNSFSEFRENNDNVGRPSQRHQMIRKEVGRLSLKHSNRESDFAEDVNKIETLFRAGQIETEKLLTN